ncbi:ribonuclease P protein subunit p25 [Bufo bufo]|uniref:ribonuclease P protein subunit p25 n=1 Tax=Bufo bufo TaxID=8384 RepID=UPI001ABDFDDB|nr:ribonuclease P protein subunit p25 [Bufo bufo]
MENLHRVRSMVEDEGNPLPFKDLHPHVAQMRVKEGSKIRNLVGYALSYMESEGTEQIIFGAYGRAVTKAITCVEILKRQIGGLHQITKIQYKTLQEVWEQKGPVIKNPAPCLTVYKNCPSIYILLSKYPLDPQEDGYQPPQSLPTEEIGKRTLESHGSSDSKKRKINASTEGEGSWNLQEHDVRVISQEVPCNINIDLSANELKGLECFGLHQ